MFAMQFDFNKKIQLFYKQFGNNEISKNVLI